MQMVIKTLHNRFIENLILMPNLKDLMRNIDNGCKVCQGSDDSIVIAMAFATHRGHDRSMHITGMATAFSCGV